MARRDDSNRFVVSITMFNRNSNAMPIAAFFLMVAVIVLTFWFTREKR